MLLYGKRSKEEPHLASPKGRNFKVMLCTKSKIKKGRKLPFFCALMQSSKRLLLRVFSTTASLQVVDNKKKATHLGSLLNIVLIMNLFLN